MEGLADRESLRRWWQEHSELDELVHAVEARLGAGSLARTGQALDELESVLDAHFTVEERVYFPLIETLSSSHHISVRAARDGHRRISELLSELHELVDLGELAAARRTLAQLLDSLRDHEANETKLIAELKALAVELGS